MTTDMTACPTCHGYAHECTCEPWAGVPDDRA